MIRRIVEDYEAKLAPPTEETLRRASPTAQDGQANPPKLEERRRSNARGKAEWERYGSDDEELSVRVRNVDLPDGTELDAYLNGGFIGRLVLRGGYAKVKLESKKGDGVPRATEGSIMTVSLNGTELLRGTFVKD